MADPMTVQVHRGIDRPVTEFDGVRTQHGFSFGAHYLPGNTHFGLLVACNFDRIAPGAGYPEHPHQGLEIVTWVMSGTLAHEDSSTSRVSLVEPGTLQRLRAGAGVRHSETNPSGNEPLLLVQMWLVSDVAQSAPLYQRIPVLLDPGALVAAVELADLDATLYAGRLDAGQSVAVPGGPFIHLHLLVGDVVVADIPLTAGDSLRITESNSLSLTAVTPCELLIWQMSRTV